MVTTMDIPGITWRGESIDDIELLPDLPRNLVEILSEVNGFVLHEGALHVRGASLKPEWHSLRAAWRGPNSFCTLYPSVKSTDVPFAQDQLGDQFLLRDGRVFRLLAETGDIESLARSLEDFFSLVASGIEGFLNVGLDHKMQPGQLLHAYPPFCLDSGKTASLKPVPASEVILFHAEFARQIHDIPDGGQIVIDIKH